MNPEAPTPMKIQFAYRNLDFGSSNIQGLQDLQEDVASRHNLQDPLSVTLRLPKNFSPGQELMSPKLLVARRTFCQGTANEGATVEAGQVREREYERKIVRLVTGKVHACFHEETGVCSDGGSCGNRCTL